MFLKKLLVLMVLLLLLVSAGCASDTGQEGNNVNEPSISDENTSDAVVQAPHPQSSPPDLIGEVKTIQGNKVTVYKANLNEDIKPPEAGGRQKEQMSKEQRQEMQDKSPEERSQRMAERFQVTEETYDLIIPVGTSILKKQRPGSEATSKSDEMLEIGDINEGDLLMFWLEELLPEGESSVESVQIIMSAN